MISICRNTCFLLRRRKRHSASTASTQTDVIVPDIQLPEAFFQSSGSDSDGTPGPAPEPAPKPAPEPAAGPAPEPAPGTVQVQRAASDWQVVTRIGRDLARANSA